MFKNLTPKRIALYAAVLLGVFIALVYGIVGWFEPDMTNGLKMAILIFGPMLFTYILVNFALERYIYRRIKLIYKTIRQAKVSMPTKMANVARDRSVLDNVEIGISVSLLI